MKFSLYPLLMLVYTTHVIADARPLDERLRISENPDLVSYHLQWPPEKNKYGYKVEVKKPDGSHYLTATIKDPHASEPLAPNNWAGPYTYYNINGTPRIKGTMNDKGRVVDFWYEFDEKGKPKRIKHYFGVGPAVEVKTFHSNGQIETEARDFDGESYNSQFTFRPDGSLLYKSFTEQRNGIYMRVFNAYDERGILSEYWEKFGNNPAFNNRYYANGKPKELITSYKNPTRRKQEMFSIDGTLTYLRQSLNGLEEGKQITTHSGSGMMIIDHYRSGYREGEYKAILDGQVVSVSNYKGGEPVGVSFGRSGDYIFFEDYTPDSRTLSYHVESHYVDIEPNGKFSFNFPVIHETRNLPSFGSRWRYTTDARIYFDMTFKSKNGDEADFGTIKESISRYTAMDQPVEKRVLDFPLSLGKRWSDQYSTEVKIEEKNLRYIYTADAESSVSGVQKIKVGGGVFDAWIIERSTLWEKRAIDQSPVECATPTCTVSGHTREINWYAPEIGRSVLSAISIDGKGQNRGMSAQAMLRSQHTSVSELIGFKEGASGRLKVGKMQFATPHNKLPINKNFPTYMENTHEFAMINHIYLE